jgi:uncharacterized damage-inducible protein DinB
MYALKIYIETLSYHMQFVENFKQLNLPSNTFFTMTEELVKEFITESVSRINENTAKIARCMNELEEAEIWMRPNDASNSVGNLILHLCGNITQYIISSLGEIEDKRERDKEFSAKGGFSKSDLIHNLNTTVEKAVATIQSMDANGLIRKRRVQGFEISGMGNVIHVTEHYSYHTGQIIFWTKILKSKDLEFYKGIDLNKKNEN